MIARLRGVLLEKGTDHLIVDVGGVGYRVFASTEALAGLPAHGAEVTLRTYTHVREDAIELFGFADAREEALFVALLSIPKVGCRKALGILSALGASAIVAAVEDGDAARLARAPGIGKKTAERLVLELRGKLDAIAGERAPSGSGGRGGDARLGDLVAGLISLGFAPRQAERAAERACADLPEADLSQLLKAALAALRDGGLRES